MTDYKLEYVTRLFEKTNNKKIENYVITRLWHKLDNVDIKMVPQQYVSRDNSKYALTDIYFPQFGICVEVNEPAHYFTQEKIETDFKRNQEIEQKISCEVIEIDCRPSLSEIHKQIDDVVRIINNKIEIQKRNKSFNAWCPENEFSVEFWQKKKIIELNKNIGFFTIDDVCRLFNADPQKIKRGFLRKGAIAHPKNDKIVIWWPSVNPRSNWKNTYNQDTGEIIESNVDVQKNYNHFNWGLKNSETRIVFLHHKDVLGFATYKYCGVYQVNADKTRSLQKLVWTRISNKFNLETLEN